MAHGSPSAPFNTSLLGESIYEYQPLDASIREIRLLKIKPPEYGTLPNKALRVECTLHYASLDDSPEYNALSYAWDDINKTVPILLHGHVVRVTESLASALLQLQYYGVTTVWADALCINQCDILEKSSQVRMMGSIY